MNKHVIYVVTSNPGKFREIKLILSDVADVRQLSVNKVEIQSDRLEEVALYSALNAYLVSRKPLIVEDAGLFIKALNGFPGVYSSYVYKTLGVNGILKLMEGISDRSAYFKSVVVYVDERGAKTFTGIVNGVIAYEARGLGGFGFDPIFIPEGYNRTFAEMSIEEKCKISHRARALQELKKWLLGSESRKP